MKQSPINVVKQGFGSKAKLVEAVQALASKDLWIDRVSSVKGLGKVANAKLLRLHGLLTDAKARFGSRDKLIGAILDVEKRGKDAGYKQRLEALPLPRLLDLHGSATKRAKKSSAPAAAKKAPKAAKPAKPVAEAASKPSKAPAKKPSSAPAAASKSGKKKTKA